MIINMFRANPSKIKRRAKKAIKTKIKTKNNIHMTVPKMIKKLSLVIMKTKANLLVQVLWNNLHGKIAGFYSSL